jgi:hypothetical protein
MKGHKVVFGLATMLAAAKVFASGVMYGMADVMEGMVMAAARQAIIETRNSQIITVIVGLIIGVIGALASKAHGKKIFIVVLVLVVIICLVMELGIMSYY